MIFNEAKGGLKAEKCTSFEPAFLLSERLLNLVFFFILQINQRFFIFYLFSVKLESNSISYFYSGFAQKHNTNSNKVQGLSSVYFFLFMLSFWIAYCTVTWLFLHENHFRDTESFMAFSHDLQFQFGPIISNLV